MIDFGSEFELFEHVVLELAVGLHLILHLLKVGLSNPAE
jgi:hypothetical protein